MTAFIFDYTFEGLLTCVFEAYSRHVFPIALLPAGKPIPLFHDDSLNIETNPTKAARVWNGCEKNYHLKPWKRWHNAG